MTIADLKETAVLAHLNLDESELATLFPAFEQMIGYFASMLAADVDSIRFEASVRGAEIAGDWGQFANFAPLRPGVRSINEALFNNAGERDGRFLKVPNVL